MVKTLVRLLDAAGKDVVLVETVGVGQTELGVMGVADTVLVALMPDSGDAIQTLKAGIMEIADIYLVNKADRAGANRMAAAITAMLGTALDQPEWLPPVLLATAQTGEGISGLWDQVQRHRDHLTENSQLQARREKRRRQEFLEAVEEELGRRFRESVQHDPEVVGAIKGVTGKNWSHIQLLWLCWILHGHWAGCRPRTYQTRHRPPFPRIHVFSFPIIVGV